MFLYTKSVTCLSIIVQCLFYWSFPVVFWGTTIKLSRATRRWQHSYIIRPVFIFYLGDGRESRGNSRIKFTSKEEMNWRRPRLLMSEGEYRSRTCGISAHRLSDTRMVLAVGMCLLQIPWLYTDSAPNLVMWIVLHDLIKVNYTERIIILVQNYLFRITILVQTILVLNSGHWD